MLCLLFNLMYVTDRCGIWSRTILKWKYKRLYSSHYYYEKNSIIIFIRWPHRPENNLCIIDNFLRSLSAYIFHIAYFLRFFLLVDRSKLSSWNCHGEKILRSTYRLSKKCNPCIECLVYNICFIASISIISIGCFISMSVSTLSLKINILKLT